MVRRPHFLTMSVNVSKMNLRIVCDSREQCPFRFEGYPVEVETGALASADYSLHGFTDRIGIERKSMQDLIHCLGPDRERFSRELQRLKAYDSSAVVIEQPQGVLRLGHFRSRMDAGAAWQSCLALSMRFRVPFWFCDSRADAEAVTFNFLRHYARDRWRELTALNPAARIAPDATERRGPGVGMDGRPDTPQERQRAGKSPLPRAPASTGAGT